MGVEEAISIADLRALARRRLPKAVFDFIDGGAEGEITLKRNRSDFDRLQLLPRVLVNVSHRDPSTTILQMQSALPLIVSPTGLAALAWRDADIALAAAAQAHGVPFTVSTASSVSMERIREAAPAARLWFQVYVYKDRELTRRLIRRARDIECEALVLTVDAPVLGQRERDLRNRFTVPLHMTPRLVWDLARCPRWTAHILRFGAPKMRNLMEGDATGSSVTSLADLMLRNMDASLDWRSIAWLREIWPRKIVLKGVLSPADAALAVSQGIDALVVSNHGGRQLDGAASTIAMLSDVVSSVGGQAEVYIDGSVQRGSDIAKALALGARAVMVGRATLFGVAAGGGAGAARALAIFAAEFDRCMALLGCASAAKLNGSYLRHANIDPPATASVFPIDDH